MIVADASAIAAFIRKEPEWINLSRYLKRCITIDLAIKEVANVIWKDAFLRKTIDKNTALELLDVLLSMVGVNIIVEREEEYLKSALEVAISAGVSVYDALYISLAQKEALPLLTLDDKQARVAEAFGVKVIKPSEGTGATPPS